MTQTNDFYCDFVLNNKIKVKIVLETKNVLAFHHTKPSYKFHVVIIPKQHIANLSDVSEMTLIQEIFSLILQTIKREKLEDTNYRIITNGGDSQDTKHLHFHLVSGDKKLFFINLSISI